MTKEQIINQIALCIDDLMDDHVQNNLHRLGALGADSVRSAVTRLGKLLVEPKGRGQWRT